MNNEDKKAFKEWWNEFPMGHKITHDPYSHTMIAWEAACSHRKQFEERWIKQLDHEHGLYQKHLRALEKEIEMLEAENAKLKSIVMLASNASCYTEYEDACSIARQVLKELEE